MRLGMEEEKSKHVKTEANRINNWQKKEINLIHNNLRNFNKFY